MNSFRNQRLRDYALPMSTAWLINEIAEAEGKQDLSTRQSPQMLKALRETATAAQAGLFPSRKSSKLVPATART